MDETGTAAEATAEEPTTTESSLREATGDLQGAQQARDRADSMR